MRIIFLIILLISASIPSIIKRIEKYKDIESILIGLDEK